MLEQGSGAQLRMRLQGRHEFGRLFERFGFRLNPQRGSFWIRFYDQNRNRLGLRGFERGEERRPR